MTTTWYFGLLYLGTSRPKKSWSEQTNEPHQQEAIEQLLFNMGSKENV